MWNSTLLVYLYIILIKKVDELYDHRETPTPKNIYTMKRKFLDYVIVRTCVFIFISINLICMKCILIVLFSDVSLSRPLYFFRLWLEEDYFVLRKIRYKDVLLLYIHRRIYRFNLLYIYAHGVRILNNGTLQNRYTDRRNAC